MQTGFLLIKRDLKHGFNKIISSQKSVKQQKNKFLLWQYYSKQKSLHSIFIIPPALHFSDINDLTGMIGIMCTNVGNC